MAKWQFTRPGTWDYPTLGFIASEGDVIEADLAPDSWWDAADPGATVTIPATPGSGVVEPAEGTLYAYNATTNRYEPRTLAELGLDQESLSGTIVTHLAQDQTAVRIEDVDLMRSANVPGAAFTVPTYDGSGVAVHPSVLHFPGGWNGHRYWMAMTPYTDSDSEVENPSIVVSDDGQTWTVPAGLTNPIVASPSGVAYNSDPHITIGPDGLMHLMFRDYGTGAPARDRLLVMTSANGIDWSDPVAIVDTLATEQRLVSPTFWWDGGNSEWVMLAVDIVGGQNVKRLTAPAITGPWSEPEAVTIAPALAVSIWHLEARNVGGQVVMLYQDGSSAGGALWLATSDDQGRTFTRSLFRLGVGLYRSSLAPIVGSSGVSLDIFSSRLSGEMRRARVAPESTRMASALARQGRYVVGDSFARADSVSSLGLATTGQGYFVQAGTPGIAGGNAYAAVAGNTKAIVTATADGVFTLDIAAFDNQAWMMFRTSDGSNYWRAGGTSSGGYRLEKIVAGSVTLVGSLAGTPAANDRLIVECSGNSIRFSVGGAVMVADVTDAFNNGATGLGFQVTTTATRLKNLTGRTLA